jgi:hypothetical protein
VYANALWTVANNPNKFTENKYYERVNAARLRFQSFTRPIQSPLNAWLATAKVTKLKISPDGASPNGVSPGGASPDGGVVQSPEEYFPVLILPLGIDFVMVSTIEHSSSLENFWAARLHSHEQLVQRQLLQQEKCTGRVAARAPNESNTV